jgi:hypothetical protein
MTAIDVKTIIDTIKQEFETFAHVNEDIASRTNLLALNATIEAARAPKNYAPQSMRKSVNKPNKYPNNSKNVTVGGSRKWHKPWYS